VTCRDCLERLAGEFEKLQKIVAALVEDVSKLKTRGAPMSAIAYQLTPAQLSAVRRLAKVTHQLLGKIPTAIDEEVLDAIEEEQDALAAVDKAIHDIDRTGS
jgi:hypothetical protein